MGAAAARPGAGRQAILDSAAELFSQKGYRGTTISDIAERAGVNRALIAYHFGSKAGLYGELLDTAVDDAARMLGGIDLDRRTPGLERELLQAFASVYTAHPHLAPMLVREHLDPDYFLTPEAGEKLSGFMRLTRKMLASIELRPAARRYDPQVIHLICVGALIYFLITAPWRDRMHGRLSIQVTTPTLDEFIGTLADLLSAGLRGS